MTERVTNEISRERSLVLDYNEWDGNQEFEPADVSKPVTPRREADIIAEEKAEYRREWIRSHITYIFAAIAVVVVGLVVLFISLYNQNSSPISRLMSASAKDFSVPFEFSVELSKDDKPVMSYKGSADIDDHKHSIKVAYDADYTDYSYKGIVYSDDAKAVRGFYYKDKWTVRDCEDKINYYFDFAKDYKNGDFDTGSFLRFTDLTSKYNAKELDAYIDTIKDKFVSDSSVAKANAQNTEKGTEYSYDVDLNALFDAIVSDGASIFNNAEDYNAFKEKYELNKKNLSDADCKIAFTIDQQGYLTELTVRVATAENSYSMNCSMSNFNLAVTEIPVEFLETATVTPTE